MEHEPGMGYGLPGRHESFWMETAPETSYPLMPGNLETDVAVVACSSAALVAACCSVISAVNSVVLPAVNRSAAVACGQ